MSSPTVAVFCNFLLLCIPGMLFRCFLNDFEIVPVDCFDCHHPSHPHFLSALIEMWAGGLILTCHSSWLLSVELKAFGYFCLSFSDRRLKESGV